jgi:negative regulator of sigma-B (phosphoserine phosphatase)
MGAMTLVSHSASALIDWGVGARTFGGEAESGDLHVVAPFRGGVLISVIDGLGHGGEAAEASRIAAGVLADHAGEPLPTLARYCHDALRQTRGVVLSLASLAQVSRTVTWLGIGNVEGALFRAAEAAQPRRESLLLRSGVVGYQLPPLREATLSIARGDTIVFATDGIHHRFAQEWPAGKDPQQVAENIVARHSKQNDDALVLVARSLMAPP